MRKALLLFLLCSWSNAVAQSDNTVPMLIGYTFSPTSIDTSASPVSITGSIQASDNLSGVSAATLLFRSLSGNSAHCHTSGGPIAGTIVNGTWSCSGTFPQYAEAGAWRVETLYIADKVGNGRSWNTADLQLLGLPTILTVRIAPVPMPSVESLAPLKRSLLIRDLYSHIRTHWGSITALSFVLAHSPHSKHCELCRYRILPS
jgi:hypothetical protein